MFFKSSISLTVQVHTISPKLWASFTSSEVTSLNSGHHIWPFRLATAFGIETSNKEKSGTTFSENISDRSSDFSGNSDKKERGISGANLWHSLSKSQSKLCSTVRLLSFFSRTSLTICCTILVLLRCGSDLISSNKYRFWFFGRPARSKSSDKVGIRTPDKNFCSGYHFL